MRIVCPSCNTAYDAPESVVARGRPMRCARCRTEWTPMATAEDAVPAEHVAEATESLQPEPVAYREPEYAPEILPEPRLVQPPEPDLAPEPVILAPYPEMPPAPPGARKIVIIAWACSAAVLVVAFWLAVAYREDVMAHWPPSGRFYHMLGLK